MSLYKEGHCILVKGTIQQENITMVNIYAPNVNASNYMEKMLHDIKFHIDPNTIIIGDFNTFLLPIDRSSKQKNQQRYLQPNQYYKQIDLMDFYRMSHQNS